jgi:hypothetical protein
MILYFKDPKNSTKKLPDFSAVTSLLKSEVPEHFMV